MAFYEEWARLGLDAIVSGTLYVHLHTSDPPSLTNSITGTGYAPVEVIGGWTASSEGAFRVRSQTAHVHFPTPGDDWDRIAAIGLWDRASLTPNPANPPLLIQADAIPPVDAVRDYTVVVPAGRLRIRIEVGS